MSGHERDLPRRPRTDSRKALRHVRQPLPHDSASKHVQGAAHYIDDIREPEGTLHVAVGQSPKARGRIARRSISTRCAPRRASSPSSPPPTSRARTTSAPAFGDDPLFADDEISFHGQALFAVVAHDPRCRAPRGEARRRRDRGRAAERHGRGRARARRNRAAGLRLRPRRRGGGDRGGAAPARRAGSASAGRSISISKARSRSPSRARTATCIVYSSTQHPSEVQHMVAACSAFPTPCVTVRDAPHGRRLRRQGEPGDAMGRRSRRSRRASTGRPCKLRLDRDDDMIAHRQAARFPRRLRGRLRRRRPHPRRSTSSYAAALRLFGRPVAAAIADRAMFHADNAYYLPAVAHRLASGCKTNTVSNTAFRGFGGPQGMLGDRARDGRDRLRARAAIRSTSASATSTAPGAQRHALRHDGRGQRHRCRARRRARARRRTIARAARRSRPSTRPAPILKRGHRAHAGQVRHLLHRSPTSTRPARWCMSTRTARCT